MVTAAEKKLEKIMNDMLALAQEKAEYRRNFTKSCEQVISALARQDKERLAKAVKDFVSLVGEGDADELIEALSEIPVSDEKVAKSVWAAFLERAGLADRVSENFAKKEEAIYKEIVQFVLSQFFGGVSTKEDEEVAKERLAAAVKSATDVKEVIDACRTYLLVKANRLVQEMGRKQFDPEVLEAVRKEMERAFKVAYEKELRKEIRARLKKGRVDDVVTKELFVLWMKSHEVPAEEAEKVYPVLAKTRDFELVQSIVRRLREAKRS